MDDRVMITGLHVNPERNKGEPLFPLSSKERRAETVPGDTMATLIISPWQSLRYSEVILTSPVSVGADTEKEFSCPGCTPRKVKQIIRNETRNFIQYLVHHEREFFKEENLNSSPDAGSVKNDRVCPTKRCPAPVDVSRRGAHDMCRCRHRLKDFRFNVEGRYGNTRSWIGFRCSNISKTRNHGEDDGMKRGMLLLVGVVSACMLSACAPLVIGGAAVGGGTGVYMFVHGELKTDYPYPFDNVWAACEKTVAHMKATDVFPEKEISKGSIEAMIDGEWVWFSVEYKEKNLTTVSIRVGVFGNKAASQRLHDKVAGLLSE